MTSKVNEYMEAHERLALLAIQASNKREIGVLEEIVARADNFALLLNFAIAHAQTGGVPDPPADSVRTDEG